MQTGIKSLLVASVALAFIGSSARADIISFTGTTAGGPTFNRLLEDLSAQSFVGTAVAYNAVSLNVSVTGTYTFLSTARFDNFTFLYTNSFNPIAPMTNAIAGNDDLLGLTTSGYAADLTAGTNYVFVTTGFGNTDFGAFSDTIGGPGTIVATPGPAVPSDIFTFAGNTVGGPTFNRLLEDLSAPSLVGTAVAYNIFDFDVTVSGDYTFLSTALYDNFTFLYGGSFNPASPLSNAIIGNDDLLGLTTSGFTATLNAGTHYAFVTTAFGNTDFGAFSDTVGGPGALVLRPSAVPEPQPYLLLCLGLVLFVVARRLHGATPESTRFRLA